jgi:hypothetical protein
MVAYGAMSGLNLRAVDRVVKIVRELDRYHGFVAAERRFPNAPRLEAPEESPLLEAFLAGRLEMAPQTPEMTESAPKDGAAVEAPETADAAAGRRNEAFPPRLASQDPLAPEPFATGGLEMAPQALDEIGSGPEDRMTRDAAETQDVAHAAPLIRPPGNGAANA